MEIDALQINTVVLTYGEKNRGWDARVKGLFGLGHERGRNRISRNCGMNQALWKNY